MSVGAGFLKKKKHAHDALELGIPAVALGVTRGTGEHTPGEWIETDPVPAGLMALQDTILLFFFSSRRRHTRYIGDWSSDVCSSDLIERNADTLLQEIGIEFR